MDKNEIPTSPAEQPGPTKSTGNIPNPDADFADLNIYVAQKWEDNADLMLKWITQTVYKTKAEAFSAMVKQRKTVGGGRQSLTQELKQLDAEIDRNIAYVKNSLKEKYGKTEAFAYYPQFGIEHVRQFYLLPRDRNQRKLSLELLKNALIAHGIDGQKYGSAYWNPICQRYNELMTQAQHTDSTVSNIVGDKRQLKAELRKVLNSLVLLIHCNYPDTYKSVLREWGFQKEKY